MPQNLHHSVRKSYRKAVTTETRSLPGVSRARAGDRLNTASQDNFPASDRPPAAGIGGAGPLQPPARPWRPSDMRLLGVWHPTGAHDYRVDFLNTFARNRAIYRVCQRSIVVREACCPGHARAIAELRFAELEGVPDWHIHAAEVEVVAIDRSGEPGSDAAPADEKPSRRTDTRRPVAKPNKRSTL